jgi:hypothetical protein
MQDFEEDNTVNTVCIVVDKKVRAKPIFAIFPTFSKDVQVDCRMSKAKLRILIVVTNWLTLI